MAIGSNYDKIIRHPFLKVVNKNKFKILKSLYKKKISVTYGIKMDMITNQTKRGFDNGKRTRQAKKRKEKR